MALLSMAAVSSATVLTDTVPGGQGGGGGGGGSCDWERCGWLERRAEEPRKRCLARWLWLHLGLDRQQILGVGALLDVAPRLAVQAAQLGLKRVRSVQVEHVMAVGATATATVGQRSAGAAARRVGAVWKNANSGTTLA